MALNANALLTLDQVREELREKTQLYDAIIERRLNALSNTFENETGYILVEQELEGFRVDGNGEHVLRIPLRPVQEVTQIEIRYEYRDEPYITITDTELFALKDLDRFGHSHTGWLQLFEYGFLCGRGNILLDMTVGFASDHPMRSDAERLLLMQLAYEYKRWQNNEAGTIARTLADGSVSFAAPQNLLKEVRDGLDQLRLRTV